MAEENHTPRLNTEELRQRALERMQGRHGKVAEMPAGGAEELVHELEVYQAELEVQNEELHRAQVALADALRCYQDLYEHAPVGYLTLDSEGIIRRANQMAARLCSREREDLEGRRVEVIAHRGDRDKLWLLLHNALATGRAGAADLRIKRPTAASRWVHADVSLLDASPKGDGGFRLTFTDITGQKQAEEELTQAKEQLRQHADNLEQTVQERTAELQRNVEELEHFSYTITHDMRAPLRAMQGFGDMLIMGYAHSLDSAGRDYLRRIKDAAGRMDKLITDALNYAKSLRLESELECIDTKALLLGLIESYENLQPSKAEISIDGNIPTVLGNEAGLTQIFSNLLGNAVKFVNPGTTPKVRVWAETRGDNVRLWFEDNGTGIPKEYHEVIWGMFQKLDKETGGTGVGLALVKKVAERMNGSVGVESEPGNGSRFWLELKRCCKG